MMISRNIKTLAAAGLTAVVFALELVTPLGYVEWLLYLVPFVLAARLFRAASLPFLAALFTLLVVAGYFLSPSGPQIVAAINRLFGIVAVWLMTYLLIEREKSSELAERLARHDSLTGLPNRLFFTDIAALEHARARRYRTGIGILYLDADGFKSVNDTLGHDAGDDVLKQLAGRIRSSIRESDIAARIGGDEFVFLLPGLVRKKEAAVLAKKIIAAAAAPYSTGNRQVSLTVSIGISIYPDDSRDIDQLVTFADRAMYAAKKQGGNKHCFYTETLLRAAPD